MSGKKITTRQALRPGAVPYGQPLPHEQQQAENPAPVETAESVAMNPMPQEIANAFGLSFERSKEIEVELPDGRRVGMSVPKISISRLQATILKDVEFKDEKMIGEEIAAVRSLLYIDSIDGVKVDKPTNAVDREYLEQQLGIDGVDAVKIAWALNFRPLAPAELKIVKKS